MLALSPYSAAPAAADINKALYFLCIRQVYESGTYQAAGVNKHSYTGDQSGVIHNLFLYKRSVREIIWHLFEADVLSRVCTVLWPGLILSNIVALVTLDIVLCECDIIIPSKGALRKQKIIWLFQLERHHLYSFLLGPLAETLRLSVIRSCCRGNKMYNHLNVRWNKDVSTDCGKKT